MGSRRAKLSMFLQAALSIKKRRRGTSRLRTRWRVRRFSQCQPRSVVLIVTNLCVFCGEADGGVSFCPASSISPHSLRYLKEHKNESIIGSILLAFTQEPGESSFLVTITVFTWWDSSSSNGFLRKIPAVWCCASSDVDPLHQWCRKLTLIPNPIITESQHHEYSLLFSIAGTLSLFPAPQKVALH